MNESVLDQPKNDLDSSVWVKTESGEYILTEEASQKLTKIVGFMTTNEILKLNNYSVRITGSITSNQYSETSDIDLHFSSPDVKDIDAEDFNKRFRAYFEENFKSMFNEDDWHIGTHQVEVYFQANPHQDMMSIGCYDFLNRTWLIGPEFLPLDFDPYSEYYHEDMQYIHSIIDDIRSIILECYEYVIVLHNSKNTDFVETEKDSVKDKLARAANIFQKAREFRKVYSSPKSDEEAMMFRSSRKWKVADSAFKLLDKFGYLGILRELTKCYEDIENGDDQNIIQRVIDVVQNNIMCNPELKNVDKLLENELQEEGMKDLGKIAVLVSMLAAPGLTNSRALAAELRSVPVAEFNIESRTVNDILKDTAKDKRVFNGLSCKHLVNLVATIIYNEAMIDYVKYCKRDVRCLIAIGNVIGNRSANNPEKFAEEITRKDQFYSAKHILGGIKDDDYVTWDPLHLGGDKECWNQCNLIALKLINNELPDIIHGANMIANKDLDNEEAFKLWGSKCNIKVNKNSKHTFGYDKSQDGFVKYSGKSKKIVQNKTHTIRKGDTLSTIARKYNTTIDSIMAKNSWLKNANKIQIGKVLKI